MLNQRLTYQAALLALIAAAALGCEEERPGIIQVTDEPEGSPEGEPGGEPEAEPEGLVLLPDFIEVAVDPLRHVYAPGVQVLPEGTAYDQFGRPMDDLEVTFSVEPQGAATLLDTGRWRLEREGSLALVGCARGADGALKCGRRALIVDKGGPSILVRRPPAGAQLLAAEDPEVEVAGRVTDTHGDLRVVVNGQAVALDADGDFETTITPRFGINHVEIIATDGLQAVEATSGVDFLWAEAYHPVIHGGLGPGGETIDDLTGARFADGARLKIGRAFFDDGSPLVRDPLASEVLTDDLAGILELLIQEIDVMSRVPNPVADSDTLALRITEVRLDDTRVEIEVTDEGLDLYVQMRDVRVGTAGQFSVQGTTLSLDGGITATASAFVELTLKKDGAGADYEVGLSEVQLAFEEATSQFGSGEANAIFDLAEGALRGVLEDTLLEAVQGAFIDQLPDTLLGVFQSLEGALNGLSFNLETGLGPAIEVGMAAQVTTIDPVPGSHLDAILDMTVTAGGAPHFLDSRGVALSEAPDTPAPFFESSRLQIGMRLGLFNGLMHAIWDAGVLEINVFDVLPAELSFLLETATVSALLPPVITEPAPDELPNDLLITLGQLQMFADFGDQQDVYAFNVLVGADVSVDGAAITVTIAPDPQIRAWVVSTTGDAPQFSAATLEQLLLTQLWPRLEGLFNQSLSLPLPSVDLGSLGALAPSLAGMTMDIVLERPLDVRGGFLIFDGSWQGTAAFPR